MVSVSDMIEPHIVNTVEQIKDHGKVGLSIIYAPIIMPPSKTVNKDSANLRIVSLNAIMTIEIKPPKDQKPLLWVLLTNMEAKNIDQATE